MARPAVMVRVSGLEVMINGQSRSFQLPMKLNMPTVRIAGTAFGAQAYVPERHHVGVGPVAGGLERRPAGQAGELLVDVFPTVPQIVGNTPHLGVLAKEVDVARRHPAAGRERQVNRTAVFGFGFGDGAMIGGDFVGVERGLHVVDLEEVEAPGGEQVELRVIPGLRARVGLVQAVVVRIPLAHVVEVGHVLGGVAGAV